jgi:hypothetical protein
MSNKQRLYTPKNSFIATIDGTSTTLHAGKTMVREGHEILKRFPDKFRPVEVRFETTSTRRSGTRVEEEVTPEAVEPVVEETAPESEEE